MSYSVFPEVFVLVVLSFAYVLMGAKMKKANAQKNFKAICMVLLVIYTGALLWTALFSRMDNGSVRRLNLSPFYSYIFTTKFYNSFDVFKQIIDNVLVFVPLGMLLPITGKRQYTAKNYSYVIISGMAVSLIIEVLQYAFSIGMSELDDVISNTIGCAIGCGIYALTGKADVHGKSLTLKKGWFSCLLPAFIFSSAVFAVWCYREYVLCR